MLKPFLIVGLGSFFGGGTRFLSQVIVAKLTSISFPLGTMIINIFGCFLIGILFSLSDKSLILNPDIKMFLTTGFCGGFTTFSTFSLDFFGLLRDGQYLFAGLYILISVFCGFFATYLGIQLIKIL